MADTAIAITAGTGTNVDTRTEATNGNHRQVIVIGDPATNAGVAPVDATTGLSVNVTNASIAAAATLAAETTKVIGTVNNAAGTNLMGKVGIDQTTDGTTNKVASDLRLAGVAADKGPGTSGTATQRVIIDSSQFSGVGQTTGGASAPIVPPSDYGFPFDTAKMLNGTASLTPKFAKIVASSSGATTIVALVTSKKIRVLALKTTVNAAVNTKWQSHTAGDITGLSYCGAQGDGEVLPFNPLGWFETVAGEALDINLSGAVAVGGHLTYVEV